MRPKLGRPGRFFDAHIGRKAIAGRGGSEPKVMVNEPVHFTADNISDISTDRLCGLGSLFEVVSRRLKGI